jgi:cobalt-zinc-cadmium efflux system outer membrane protein
MRKGIAWATALLALPCWTVWAQTAPQPQAAAPPPSTTPAPTDRITLDDAIRLALQHNHALLAMRTTILQNQAQEITANLRPNPVLSWDAQFLPIFEPDKFTSDWLDNQAQFDVGVSYLFEIGKKRQHRLQAAKDATLQTRWLVSDNERQLTFNVAQQFVSALLAESTLAFAEQDLKSFQQTVEISEARRIAGAMSEVDLLKIKLQLLQFQADVNQAKLARVQALAALRQQLGFESVPDAFDVVGDLDYQPVHGGLDEFKAMALRSRPDLMAARQGVVAAQSSEKLAEANVKRDLGTTFNYSHISSTNTGAFFFNIQLPIFDRNQGEVARTKHVITQNQQLAQEASQQALTDVVDAYAALRANDEIVQLYRGGYVDQAKQSRDISEYAYRRGAASLLDYLDAERSYRTNQLAYRQALASYMVSVEQMRQAVGTRNLP